MDNSYRELPLRNAENAAEGFIFKCLSEKFKYSLSRWFCCSNKGSETRQGKRCETQQTPFYSFLLLFRILHS